MDFCGRCETEEAGIQRIQKGIVFPIIHGAYGEDGEIQTLLEKYNIPFFGSGSKAMKLTIDKQKTGDFLTSKRFRTPKSVIVSEEHTTLDIPFPLIVKPCNEGSSVSLYKVQNPEELQDVLQNELLTRKEILVQEFVKGREFTCGVVEIHGETIALLPTEVILTKGELFDYEAKYQVGGCTEVTPAEVDPETLLRIQQTSLGVHQACGCKDISRTDMILNTQGELVVLEINTIPGMTPTSFVPAELVASGYSVAEFL